MQNQIKYFTGSNNAKYEYRENKFHFQASEKLSKLTVPVVFTVFIYCPVVCVVHDFQSSVSRIFVKSIHDFEFN